jgi:hypothetical protein
LISRSVTGRANGLLAAISTVDQSPSFAVGSGYAVRVTLAQIISRSEISDAGPARFALSNQIRPRIGRRLLFHQPEIFHWPKDNPKKPRAEISLVAERAVFSAFFRQGIRLVRWYSGR